MEYAMSMFAWILGTVFGALSVTSVERGERTEKARTYSRLMAGFYLLAFLVIAVTELASWVQWTLG